MYIKDCFKTKILEDCTFLNEIYEILSIELDLGLCKYVLILTYHPPSSSGLRNTEFVNLFTLTLRTVLDLRMLIIVMGDINLNLLNLENLNYINAFINNMLELNMHPAITRPTRITLVSQGLHFSLLYQIWTTTRADPARSFILAMSRSITDHFPVGIIIENVNQTSNISREIERRVFSERNKETFKTLFK